MWWVVYWLMHSLLMNSLVRLAYFASDFDWLMLNRLDLGNHLVLVLVDFSSFDLGSSSNFVMLNCCPLWDCRLMLFELKHIFQMNKRFKLSKFQTISFGFWCCANQLDLVVVFFFYSPGGAFDIRFFNGWLTVGWCKGDLFESNDENALFPLLLNEIKCFFVWDKIKILLRSWLYRTQTFAYDGHSIEIDAAMHRMN